MTALSIRNMNWTVGQRELDAKASDKPNPDFMTEYNLGFWMQQFEKAFRKHDKAEMRLAHRKIEEIANSDPAHVRYADPRTPEQIDADQDAAEWRATYASLLP